MVKENSSTMKIVLAFVTLILGIALLGSVATQVYAKTSLATYTDTVNIAPLRMVGGGLNYTLAESNKLYSGAILSHPAGTNWKTDFTDCAITTIKYYNQTGSLMSNSADYTWVQDGNGAQGWLRLKNVDNLNNSMVNSTTLTYTTCPDDYQTNTFGRSALNLIPGFFGLALMLVSLGLFYSIFKDTGII